MKNKTIIILLALVALAQTVSAEFFDVNVNISGSFYNGTIVDCPYALMDTDDDTIVVVCNASDSINRVTKTIKTFVPSGGQLTENTSVTFNSPWGRWQEMFAEDGSIYVGSGGATQFLGKWTFGGVPVWFQNNSVANTAQVFSYTSCESGNYAGQALPSVGTGNILDMMESNDGFAIVTKSTAPACGGRFIFYDFDGNEESYAEWGNDLDLCGAGNPETPVRIEGMVGDQILALIQDGDASWGKYMVFRKDAGYTIGGGFKCGCGSVAACPDVSSDCVFRGDSALDTSAFDYLNASWGGYPTPCTNNTGNNVVSSDQWYAGYDGGLIYNEYGSMNDEDFTNTTFVTIKGAYQYGNNSVYMLNSSTIASYTPTFTERWNLGKPGGTNRRLVITPEYVMDAHPANNNFTLIYADNGTLAYSVSLNGLGDILYEPKFVTSGYMDTMVVLDGQIDNSDSMLFWSAQVEIPQCTQSSDCGNSSWCNNNTQSCEFNNINLTIEHETTLIVNASWVDGLTEDHYLLWIGNATHNQTDIAGYIDGGESDYRFYWNPGGYYLRLVAYNASNQVIGMSNIVFTTFGADCTTDAECGVDMYCNWNNTCTAFFNLSMTVATDFTSVYLEWPDQVQAAWDAGCANNYYFVIYKGTDLSSLSEYDTVAHNVIDYLDNTPNLYTNQYYQVRAECTSFYRTASESDIRNATPQGGAFSVTAQEAYSVINDEWVVSVDWMIYNNSAEFDYYLLTRNGTDKDWISDINDTNYIDDDVSVGDSWNYSVYVYDCTGGMCFWPLGAVLVENSTIFDVDGCPTFSCPVQLPLCNTTTNLCDDGCDEDADCDEGYYCNTNNNQCQPQAAECSADADCANATQQTSEYLTTDCDVSGSNCFCDDLQWRNGVCKNKVADNSSCYEDAWCSSDACTVRVSQTQISTCVNYLAGYPGLGHVEGGFTLCSNSTDSTDYFNGVCMFDSFCYESTGVCQGASSGNCTQDSDCSNPQYCSVSVDDGSLDGICLDDKPSTFCPTCDCLRPTWCEGYYANASDIGQCLSGFCVNASWGCWNHGHCGTGQCNFTSNQCLDCNTLMQPCVEETDCCSGKCIGNVNEYEGDCVNADLECVFNPEETTEFDYDYYCHCANPSIGDTFLETPEEDRCAYYLNSKTPDLQPEWCHSEEVNTTGGAASFRCIGKYSDGVACDRDYQCLSGDCSWRDGANICIGEAINESLLCQKDEECPTPLAASANASCGLADWACVPDLSNINYCVNMSVRSFACTSDGMCGTSGKYSCVAGVCYYQDCTSDNDCRVGSYCKLECGECRFVKDDGRSCTRDGECDGGWCNNNFCDSKECSTDSDCTTDRRLGQGFFCDNGECKLGNYTVTVEAMNRKVDSGYTSTRWDYVIDCEKRDYKFNYSTSRDSTFYYQRGYRDVVRVNSDLATDYVGSVNICSALDEEAKGVDIGYYDVDFFAANDKGIESSRLRSTVAVLRDSLDMNISIVSEVGSNVTWQIITNRPARCEYRFAREGDGGNFSTNISTAFSQNMTTMIVTPGDMNPAFFTLRCYDQFNYNETQRYGFNVSYYTSYLFDLVGSIVFWVFLAFVVLPVLLIYYIGRRRGRGET